MRDLLTSWPRRHRRGILRTSLVLAVLYALYLIAANVFLNTALGERVINRKPERYHASWSWAMSLYPGHIYARGIAMGGHARTTVWTARSPVAHGRIQLLPLLGKTLSFGTIHASDVDFGVDKVTRDLPPPPRNKKPWTLHFDAITTDSLRSVRYGRLVADGGGEVSVGIDKELRGGPLEVMPSALHMPRARVRNGDQVLLDDARIDFDFALSPHIRAQAKGAEKIEVTDARLRVRGRAPGLDLKQGDDGALAVGRGRDGGQVVADLAIEHGALVAGGRAHWSAPVTVHADGTVHRYRALVDVDVRDDAIGLRVQVPKQKGSDAQVDADLAFSGRRIDDFDARHWLRRTSGSIDLQWHFTSLAWMNPMLSDGGWLRLDGEADLQAALRVSEGRLARGSRVDVEHAALQADLFDNVVTGDASAQARVGDDTTTVAIVAKRFEMAPVDDRGAPYLKGEDLRLDLRSSGDLARFKDHLKARIRFNDARIPDLRNYNRNLPGDSLRFLGGSGRMSGDLAIDAAGDVGSGELHLRGDRAAIQLGVSKLTGNLRIDTNLKRIQRRGRRFDLDGFAMGLDDVRVDGAGGAEPWWARFALDDGMLEWTTPFKVGGRARLDMKDASVLLSLFAERSAFPKWIGSVVDSGETNATGLLKVDGDTLILDRIRASNDRVDLDARLMVAGGKPSGDLYARWGVLGLGVQLGGGARTFHVAGAKKWYDAQPSLLPVPRASGGD